MTPFSDEKVDTSEQLEFLRSIYERLSRGDIAQVHRIEVLPDNPAEAVGLLRQKINQLVDARNVVGAPLERAPETDGGVQAAIEALQARDANADRLRQIITPTSPIVQVLPPMLIEKFWAKITDETSGSYSWEEHTISSASGALTWSKPNGGRTGTKSTATEAREINLQTGVAINTIVEMWAVNRQNGKVCYVFPKKPHWELMWTDNDSFAVVDKADAANNHQGLEYTPNIKTHQADTDTRRLLVKFRRPYGATRKTERGFVYADLFSTVIDIDAATPETLGGNRRRLSMAWMYRDVAVHPITADFDPSTVTWDNQPAVDPAIGYEGYDIAGNLTWETTDNQPHDFVAGQSFYTVHLDAMTSGTIYGVQFRYQLEGQAAYLEARGCTEYEWECTVLEPEGWLLLPG